MPQLNKMLSGNNPAGKAPTSEKHTKLRSEGIDRARKQQRRTAIIITSVVIVLVLITVGVSLYINSAPFRRIIITVDDNSINMDYFLKRARLAGADPTAMLEQLTNELVIKIEAPQPPYNIEVSPEDIDQELRRIASGASETISESEFKAWYRQVLNETKLSDTEYRENVAISLLAARLHAYLAARVSTVAEQVHLHATPLSTGDIEKMWEKEDEGEDLAKFASEIWQDKQSEGEVEDLGWLPRGVLFSGFDQVAFSLTIGEVSEPVVYSGEDSTSEEIYYYLLMVSEKAAARQIDEEPLQILQGKALDDWLLEEIKFHEIGWHGLKNGFDSETYAWIHWQLTKK
jgi:hypothetical protein